MIGAFKDNTFHSTNNLSAMKSSFYLKKDYKNKNDECQIYLNINIHGQRKRIPTGLYLKEMEWNKKKQMVIKSKKSIDYNLVLQKIKATINEIEIRFRLNNEVLTVEKCAELIKKPDLSIDFVAFFEYAIELKNAEIGTIKRHRVIKNKLKEFKPSILFSELNISFLKKFRKHLKEKKQNKEVTIDSNLKVIKHYLRLAKKQGIKINVDLEDIKIKRHSSNRVNLSIEEVELMKDYYFSNFIRESHKQTLGYFLFNCHTGLRINDLLCLNREDLKNDFFSFWNQKSKKQQILMTNKTCKSILEHNPYLFVKKITPKQINLTIKDICKFLGINKKVSCHIARHTFATNYLRKGGKVEDLQVLLGHADVTTTMIYVHMVEGDVAKTTRLLD